MKGQPNRLTVATAGPFAGGAIDRNRPLQFRLNGRTLDGFVGDTVLSAALAAGIDSVGQRGHSPLALSTRCAPAIIATALAADQQRALAMERTLATDGAEYLTLAPRRGRGAIALAHGLAGARTTLGLDLAQAMPLPWLGTIGAVETPADLIVVGGGVAGMSAAVAAQQAGLSVILLEASPRLGGCARLFGALAGEETAEASLRRLGTAMAGADGIIVVTHASVFAARPGAIRVHITDRAGSMPSARVVDLHARHIVLATGSCERLPLFAGNRLPGTVGVREAHDLAEDYGVWCGASALLATSSNVAYRLAMLAADAGIAVPRIIDARPQPQSRFIEFSKAYGITQAAGTIVADARPAPQGRGLAVAPRLMVEDFSRDEAVLTADRLVVCGGWQPDLELWHMAGGESVWNGLAGRLEAGPGPAGLVLAGNAAGHQGLHACLTSGQAAINQLLGRPHQGVHEFSVDPIYETPDAPTPVASAGTPAAAACFLDAGRHGVERPPESAAPPPAWRFFARSRRPWSLDGVPQALAAADVAACVQLGLVGPAAAGLVARERVAMVTMKAGGSAEPSQSAVAPLLPAFLAGRFGAAAQLWRIKPDEARQLQPGALIHSNSDASDPAEAIGVVLQQTGTDSVALIAAHHAMAGRTAAVREKNRSTIVRLVAACQESAR
ncbi:MAG: FAD-dependent oxidoreductase [Devosia sp.]